jgi:hypothetical protein
MQILCLSSLLLLFLAGVAVPQQDSLESVLRLNTAALGGKEAIEKIQSVEIKLTIQEPTFTVDAVYVADRKIRMRIDIYSDGKRVFTEAFDGQKGWQMGEDGVAKDASPDGTKALRAGIFLPGKFFGLYELPPLGHRLAYQGKEEINKISYHVLKLTLDHGKETYLYIHPESGLVERKRDVKALHPDVDATTRQIESVNSDFRKVAGTVRSYQSTDTDLKTGEIIQTTTVKEIKINPELQDSLFRKP